MRRTLVTTAVLGMAAFSANAQNLLSNGSFETPGPGFVVFEDWQHFNNVFADMSVEQAAQDGMTSGKMFGFGNGQQNDHGMFQVVDGLMEGEEYTLSGYVLNPSNDQIGSENVIIAQLNFLNSGGGVLETVQVEVIDPDTSPLDQWVLGEVSGIAPVGTTGASVYLLHIQLGADQGFPTQDGGASFWDNFMLIQGEGSGCNNPADLNGDGMLNFLDVSLFLQLFGEGC
jgi:hypothetical protein